MSWYGGEKVIAYAANELCGIALATESYESVMETAGEAQRRSGL